MDNRSMLRMVDPRRPAGNGCQRAFGRHSARWVLGPIAAGPRTVDPGESMRRNPFIDFNRHAEALGYPALLLVSLGCLGLVLGGVGLLAVWSSGWALALALCSLFLAVAILSAAVVALVEADER